MSDTAERKRPRGAQEYKGNGKHEWEYVTSNEDTFTQRLRVPGGWIYETTSYNMDDDVVASSSAFAPVPDAVGYAV